MANQEQLALLKQGVVQWNQWREQHPEVNPDLNYARLRDADLRGADLRTADLRGADLYRADLREVHLRNAHLREADLRNAGLSAADLSAADLSRAHLSDSDLSEARLSEANLRGAHLRDTHLRGADLSAADLSAADLSRAHLSGTDLRRAIVEYTVFASVDLRQVKGLAELDHRGPSRIELHTILLPQDGSALHFLRGAGVPDEWIDFWRPTMMHPVQYHSLFISYSGRDETFARRLHADLQDQGVRCWFAPEDMKIGDKIRPRIDEAIHVQDKLLLLLSEHALASSWVEDEVEAAIEKEQQQKRAVLFPIRLDDAVMQTSQAWAAKLRRSTNIGDFTNWTDPQAYQQAFERLLRDLKDERKPEV